MEDQSKLQNKISEEDRLALELAKMNRRLAMSAMENAELQFKYTVMQMYIKYSLGALDAIDENGNIIKNGAASQTGDAEQ